MLARNEYAAVETDLGLRTGCIDLFLCSSLHLLDLRLEIRNLLGRRLRESLLLHLRGSHRRFQPLCLLLRRSQSLCSR